MLLNSYGSYYHMKRSTEIQLSFGKGNKMQTSSTVISLYVLLIIGIHLHFLFDSQLRNGRKLPFARFRVRLQRHDFQRLESCTKVVGSSGNLHSKVARAFNMSVIGYCRMVKYYCNNN